MGAKVFENKTPLEPEEACIFGEVYVSSQGMVFMNYCSVRMPRLQPVVAHELLPYLELLIRGLMSRGITGKKDGFPYFLSSVAEAQPAGEGSGLGSALPMTWLLGHYLGSGLGTSPII